MSGDIIEITPIENHAKSLEYRKEIGDGQSNYIGSKWAGNYL